MSNPKFAPELTFDQWQKLPIKERSLRRVAYYADKLHVQEDFPHRNRGEIIDQWAKSVGATLGDPWCVIAQMANLIESGADPSKLPSNKASTHALYDWAKATGRLTKTPTRGDLFVILFTSTTGHAGAFVKENYGGAQFSSIEGNTNDDGSREGYEMARRNQIGRAHV